MPKRKVQEEEVPAEEQIADVVESFESAAALMLQASSAISVLTQALVCFACLFLLAAGHARWKCPLPRDADDEQGHHIKFDNTGNKVGACGPESNKWGFGTVTTIAPGWTTFTWEESISHEGSPFRLAILDETETAQVILLDHIPHWDAASPIAYIERTYVDYKMSVNIPDVNCTKCSLQLLYVMSDKTVKCGTKTCYYKRRFE